MQCTLKSMYYVYIPTHKHIFFHVATIMTVIFHAVGIAQFSHFCYCKKTIHTWGIPFMLGVIRCKLLSSLLCISSSPVAWITVHDHIWFPIMYTVFFWSLFYVNVLCVHSQNDDKAFDICFFCTGTWCRANAGPQPVLSTRFQVELGWTVVWSGPLLQDRITF